jgi:hypothetical protein
MSLLQQNRNYSLQTKSEPLFIGVLYGSDTNRIATVSVLLGSWLYFVTSSALIAFYHTSLYFLCCHEKSITVADSLVTDEINFVTHCHVAVKEDEEEYERVETVMDRTEGAQKNRM